MNGGTEEPYEPPDYLEEALDRLESAHEKYIRGPFRAPYAFVIHCSRHATHPGLWASTPVSTFPLTSQLIAALPDAGCWWWGAHLCTLALADPAEPLEAPICELSCRLALGPRHATSPSEFNFAYALISPVTVAAAGLPIVCERRPRGWPAFSLLNSPPW